MGNLKLNIKLSQQLVMTPQLQQAIKLLQMSRLELQQTIGKELLENPVLEEGLNAIIREDKDKPSDFDDNFDWEKYVESYNVNSSTPAGSRISRRSNEDQFVNIENMVTKTESLYDHLVWQLRMTGLSKEEEEFGKLIIENINDDGYLDTDFEKLKNKTELSSEEAEEVLLRIQEFDPVGIGARDIKECLLQQVRQLNIKDTKIVSLIKNYLDDFEKRDYKALSRKLDITESKVVELAKIILSLEPKPGRAFTQNDAQYIIPDVYVVKVNDEFVINLNEEGLPSLKISSYYRNIIHDKNIKDDPKAKEYIQDKIRSAVALIKSIQHRQKTIYKVTEAIFKRQKDFLDFGVSKLRPMILREIAEDIDMHESTVSRITTNKYVHTQQGIFELKFFFNNPISSLGGEQDVASASARELIKKIVGSENPKKPFSDQQIADQLKKHNIDIARRTVAKYREMLNILPSSKRKKHI